MDDLLNGSNSFWVRRWPQHCPESPSGSLLLLSLNTLFSGLMWKLQAHLVHTLSQPRNQPWFLLLVLETKIWFSHDIHGVLLRVFFSSLKTYTGHRPNGFHNPEFEEHFSRVTHSLVTGIFWKPRPSSRRPLCISTQFQESLGANASLWGREAASLGPARDLVLGRYRLWSCLGQHPFSKEVQKPGLQFAVCLLFIPFPWRWWWGKEGDWHSVSLSPQALLVVAAENCHCDLSHRLRYSELLRGPTRCPEHQCIGTEPWDHTHPSKTW